MSLLDNASRKWVKELPNVTAASTVKLRSFVQHVTRNVVIAKKNVSIAYLASSTRGEEDAKATNAKSAEANASIAFIVPDVLFCTGND